MATFIAAGEQKQELHQFVTRWFFNGLRDAYLSWVGNFGFLDGTKASGPSIFCPGRHVWRF